MKTILVPTDYSANAHNATAYAAELAKAIRAKVIMLHVFHLPAIIDGAPVRLNSLDDLSKRHSDQINILAQKLREDYQVPVDGYVLPGYISEILPDFVKQQSVDLVIMGMRGLSNVEKLFFGSITSNILKKANFPLLIVPFSARFYPIKHILLACDYHSDAVNKRLSLVKDSALAFNALVKVLHIGKAELELAEMEERIQTGQNLERLLKGVKHVYSRIEDESIVEGILKTIDNSKVDLLVMIPRKRSFWQSLTEKSNTKKIAFNVQIPLLALPHSDEPQS